MERRLNFYVVASKIISKERRVKCESQALTDSALVVKDESVGKKNSGKNVTCWKCEKSEHVKRNCPNGASSTKVSKSDANIYSLSV